MGINLSWRKEMTEYIYVTEEVIGYNTKDNIPEGAFLLGEYTEKKFWYQVSWYPDLYNINDLNYEDWKS